MQDFRGGYLHGHRRTDLLQGGGQFILGGHHLGAENRESVAAQDFIGLVFGQQDIIRLGQLAADYLPGLVAVGGHAPDRPFGLTLGIAEGDHGGHGPDRGLGKGVVGNAVLFQEADPGGDIHQAHEAGQKRFFRAFGHQGQDLGRLQDIGHGLGGQNDDGPVHPFVLHDVADGGLVALVGGVSDNIHGVVDVGRGG